jgi:adenine-specific DNA-methyltransferase
MNKRFSNPDNDPEGLWAGKDPTAKEIRKNTGYAIQSPFTGYLHYPETEYSFEGDIPHAKKHWTGLNKHEMKSALEEWGVKYVETDIGDKRGKALIIKGANVVLDSNYDVFSDKAVSKAKKVASKRRQKENWSKLIFLGANGEGRPRIKNYLNSVKQGKVPLTYWANDEYDDSELLDFGIQSWAYTESGHSQTGITELNAILGANHGFQTVKPLRLIEKIIQLWCPVDGIVFDPFAGSGTTGHAVLELNYVTDSNRNFILVEKGEGDDAYAKTLTRTRIVRAITGERVDKTNKVAVIENVIENGFEYWELDEKIDAEALLNMKRESLIDVITTSHWEDDKRKTASFIQRFDKGYEHLIGTNGIGEGFFIIWKTEDGKDVPEKDSYVGQLDKSTYMQLLSEAKKEGVKTPYHVYARYQIYQTSKVKFYQIPDKVLMHLGLNENSDRYNNEVEE